MTRKHTTSDPGWLQSPEEFYRGIFEQAADAMFVLNSQGIFIDANPRCSTLLERTRNEIIGTSFEKLIREEDLQADPLCLPEVLAGGTVVKERLLRCGGDRLVPVEISACMLPTGDLFGIARDISLRRAAEASLQEKSRELDQYFTLSKDLLSIATTEGYFVRLNPEWERALGYPPDQLVGEPFLDLVHPGDRNATRAAMNELSSQREVLDFVNRCRHKDGSYRWIEWRSFPSGKLVYAAGRDITDRKTAEDELRRNARLLEESQRVAQLGSYVFDVAAGTWESSPILDELFGTTDPAYPRDVDGWLGVVHPEERGELARYLNVSVLQDKNTFDREYRIVRVNDGSERWVHGRGELRLDESGQPVEMIGTIQDITERKHVETDLRRAEEEQRGSEERYRRITEAVTDYIYAVRVEEGRAVETRHGPGCVAVTGYREEEFSADPNLWLRMVDPKDRPLVEEQAHRVLHENVVAPLEHRIVRKDGVERWVRNTPVPRYDRHGRLVSYDGLIQDVTERRRMEEDRLELERRLLHAQKLESLGVLAGGIAHDFNNLIMAILGNLELALMKISPLAPSRSNLEHAMQAAYRSADLTRQMLAYSGRGRFVIQKVDLNLLVKENTHLLRASIGKNVSLDLRLAPDLPVIDADAAQIQQVIMNLITNASEAVGEAIGSIVLSTSVEECDDERLKKTRLDETPPPGMFVCLEVSDTGVGMAPQTEQRLFEPFFTTKELGRGLGMSAILGIVRGHHGALFVKTGIGSGCTMQVLFPVLPTASGPRHAEGEGVAEHGEGVTWSFSGTVLIVDDEEIVRNVCREMLESLGFTVLTASDGTEALRLFQTEAEGICAVLLDLSMPNMDGAAALDGLLEIRPDIKVILSSGYDQQDAMQRLSSNKVAGFVQKPYRLEKLRATLEQVLGSC